ncbi:MAG TPA: methyltransferase domain-containing protein [Myxococcota bacterium]|nr:methyltransferase domain-containing protein [Myxococcota bacterium]
MSDPSRHVVAHLAELREGAALGPVVDLACGRGRNALAIAAQGIPVLGVDRNTEFLLELCRAAHAQSLAICAVRADLEGAPAPPLAEGRCGALVVCRYLHRPLAPVLEALLAPGGWLLYETFTIHQRDLGYGPENPAFLLDPGELPALFSGLAVAHHWEGVTDEARPAAMAQLAAQKPD